MRRLPLILGVAGLALAAGAPAQAQLDADTQRLIEQLRPRDAGALDQTRGLRRPTQSPGEVAPAAPVAPTLTPALPAAPTLIPSPAPTQPAVAPRPVPAPPPAPRTTTAPEGVAAVSLTVNFATGSDQLTPAARRTLDSLGRALTSGDLAPYRFRIEGHTDTVGSAALNQALSERRAAAVRAYLEENFRIDPARLEAVGLGQTQLLVPTPDNTANAQNRRVQVINLGP